MSYHLTILKWNELPNLGHFDTRGIINHSNSIEHFELNYYISNELITLYNNNNLI